MENIPKRIKRINPDYIERVLSDGHPIYKPIHFEINYKMDVDFAIECYQSQFQIDPTIAETKKEFKILTKRKEEIESLLKAKK